MHLDGSPFFFSLENQKFIAFAGKILSAPKACNVLGATIIEPKADEIVAAAKPIGIIGPHKCNFRHYIS